MYTEITEHCGNEGEEWTTFVKQEGNEAFLSKLEETISKFPDIEGSDSYLELGDKDVDLAEVNIMVKRSRSGYMDSHSKCDNIIDPAIIVDSDEDDFVDSYYKGKYFD